MSEFMEITRGRLLTKLNLLDRASDKIEMIEKYLAATRQLRDYSDASQDPAFSKVVVLDLSTVVTSVSGPKRPHDRVSVVDMQQDFRSCLTSKVRTGVLKSVVFMRQTLPSDGFERDIMLNNVYRINRASWG